MINDFFKIDKRLLDLSQKAEELCRDEFSEIDRIAEYNSQKVLAAFINNRVSEVSLKGST